MKHTMNLLIADKAINGFMGCADLKPDYKCFVKETQRVTFETTSTVNSEYVLNLIEKSKSNKGFWIPGIEFGGVLYVSPEIKEISNGKKIIFLLTPYL